MIFDEAAWNFAGAVIKSEGYLTWLKWMMRIMPKEWLQRYARQIMDNMPGRAPMICHRCGQTFDAWRKDILRRGVKYCSFECLKNRITKECQHCGKPVSRKASHFKKIKLTFCSRPCIAKWLSINQRGSASPLWKGGHFYQSTAEWMDIRNHIRRRDKNKCVNCGSTKRLHVHHIVPFRIAKEHNESNLITLCQKCHVRAHKQGKHDKQLDMIAVPHKIPCGHVEYRDGTVEPIR